MRLGPVIELELKSTERFKCSIYLYFIRFKDNGSND